MEPDSAHRFPLAARVANDYSGPIPIPLPSSQRAHTNYVIIIIIIQQANVSSIMAKSVRRCCVCGKYNAGRLIKLTARGGCGRGPRAHAQPCK